MMSKARKWIIRIGVALTAIFCVCGAVACGEPKRLDTPENLQLEGRMLTWDEVDGADGYAVYVDDQEYLVEDNAFEIPFLAGPKTYRVEVMALGDWKKTKDSVCGEIEYTRGLPEERGEKDGFHFVLMDDLESYEIVGCDNKEGYVEFPDDYLDYPVKKIGDYLFAPPKENNYTGDLITGENCNQITTGIKLPRYLEEIGDYAFGLCIALEEVVIPDSVTMIGDGGFGYCVRLKEVHFPTSLRIIGGSAFSWSLYGMKDLIFPDGIESIGNYAFRNPKQLIGRDYLQYFSQFEKVVIPKSIKTIGQQAFADNQTLKEVEIRTDNIEEWGYGVFDRTAWYENQPDGIIYIDKVLYGCKGELPENYKLTVNADVVGIAGNAFRDQENLTEVWIADGVKLLGIGIFTETGLTSVRLPADLTVLPEATFYCADNVFEIEIPESVTEIEKRALYAYGLGKFGRLIIHTKCKMENAFNFRPKILYQGVEYSYSAKRPITTGNYWYVDEDGYFAIWE